jgi:F0F1-type ATP synthase assembly protein I
MADTRDPRHPQPIEDSSSSPQNKKGEALGQDSADQKVGWIESLAHRSTGLPGTEKKKPAAKEKSPWRYAGLGLQFAGTAGLFVFMGYKLDERQGWSPWGTVSLGMLGVIGGLYLLIKEVIKENAESERRSNARRSESGPR